MYFSNNRQCADTLFFFLIRYFFLMRCFYFFNALLEEQTISFPIRGGMSVWNFYKDQAFNRPRGWRFWTSLKPPTIVLRVFRGCFIGHPFMPRPLQLVTADDKNSSLVLSVIFSSLLKREFPELYLRFLSN